MHRRKRRRKKSVFWLCKSEVFFFSNSFPLHALWRKTDAKRKCCVHWLDWISWFHWIGSNALTRDKYRRVNRCTMYIMCIGPTLLNTLYTCYSCIKMCVYFDGATLLHSRSIESITFQRSFDRTLNTLPFNLLEYNNASNKKKQFLHFIPVKCMWGTSYIWALHGAHTITLHIYTYRHTYSLI